jgi:RHS repeat-associated protein
VDYSSDYKHAYPTLSTTAVPDPSGQHGSTVAFTTSGTFDFNTGKTLTNTDVNGQVTTYSFQDDQGNYDVLGRLRKITRPDGGWTKYSFGETLGSLYVMTEVRLDATRSLKNYQYTDPLGRNSRTFASEDGTNYLASDTIYDQMGREWKTSNAYRTTTLDGVADLSHTNHWTVRAFDPLSRTVSVTMADGAVTQVSYQGIYTTVTDESGMQRRQKIDSFGRVVRIDEQDASGNLGSVDTPNQATYYDYNARGDLVHVKQGLDAQTLQHRYFKYDAIGRLTYERQVEQAGTFSVFDPVTSNSSWSRKLVYDETINSVPYPGLLTTTYDARNVSTQFRYDQVNRIYQVNYSDGTPTVNNNYDQARATYFNKGRLTEALTAAVGSIPATAQLYNFDLMGRISNHQQTVGAQSYSMGYGYNVDGMLTSQTYPSGRVVNYAYNDGGRLSQVSSGATTYASNYDYTSPTGLLKAFTLGNGAVTSFVYNSRLQIQSLDLTKNGTQIQHYDYKYGAYDPNTNSVDQSKNAGQIAEIEGFIGTQKQWQQRFAYDKLGRLSSAREFRGDNSQQSYLVNYEYDVFGNRYQKQAQNGGNPFPQIWVESNHVDQATNRLSSGVTYDNAGNVTIDSKFHNLQFQYDANNRQKQSSNLDGSGAVLSVYDALGQRVGTQVGASLINVLVYDAQSKLLAEYSSTSAQGGTQYIFTDHQGSPRVITGNAGQVISRHDYQAFGDELGSVGLRASTPGYGGTDAARQKYAGMERNETTALAHTLWREYDSLSGRWTSPDPAGKSMAVANPQSFNRYAYVQNDPVNRTDPTGLMPGPETSWQDVAGDFWGKVIPFNQPHFGGPEVIGERMLAIDTAVAKRIAELKMNNKAFFNNDDGDDVIVTNSYAFKSKEEALAYYKSLFGKFWFYQKKFIRHHVLGALYVLDGISRLHPDGIQASGSALWVFSGSLTITNDGHIFVGVDTPNVADLLKFGLAGKIISKPTQVLGGSVTAVKILGLPTTEQRDGFFGGTNFNVAAGSGPYGGVSVAPDGTTAVMGGVGEGINIGASFSPKEPTFKIPHPTFEQMRSFVRRVLRD